MTTALFSHVACFHHDTGPGHPERPARLKAVLDALDVPAFAALVRRDAPLATVEALALAHPRAFVEELLAALPEDGLRMIDGDTIVSPGSKEAALRAAGAVVAAVDAVCARDVDNAFCAVRPPGHHAEPDRAMGFCLFNNVAVGAHYAQQAHGLERVAVIDFDVHHGNGTETQALADAGMFFASTHQSPLYPGTGTDNSPAHPNVLNLPLPPGADGADFRAVWEAALLPALAAFAPQMVFVSAGFDAHASDPLAQMRLVEDDYAWATERLLEQARASAEGRLVSTLEGGYDLAALAASAAAHVRALMAA